MDNIINFSNMESSILKFEVTMYGEIQKLTETLSKTRVRIFYRGMNRNRTYISEEFAQKLISSLPYAPIKGIFDQDAMDFEGHGEDNTDGRIYGIIPENPNFAWEKHLDDDGVEREYATADVYLFTGLYPEAKLIPGKSQSMEIYKKTFKGEWRISEDDNQPFFFFTDGCLVGLQALGDDCEPCFEGAAFFSLYNHIKECLDQFTKNKKEGDKVGIADFRLSDNEKYDLIFTALNPNYTEEGGWALDYYIMDVYDEYALCKKKKDYSCVRAYYTKDNASDTVTLGEIVNVKIVDITESEAMALEAIKATAGNYETEKAEWDTEKVSLESAKEELETKVSELETEKATYETEKATLTEEKAALEATLEENKTAIEEYTTKIAEMETEKATLEEAKANYEKEIEDLKNFKSEIEKAQTDSVIEELSNSLTDEKIQEFKDAMANYSVADFKKEVCMAAYEANKGLLNNNHAEELIYKNNGSDGDKFESGAIRILRKNKKGGNK